MDIKNIKIYKVTGCGYCEKVIELMERARVRYDTILVGTDIPKEEFQEMYPMVGGFPFVVIDGEPIGGLMETVKLFVEKKLVTSKKQ